MKIQVTLLDGPNMEGPYSFVLELPLASTLFGLHDAIMKATKFDNDHLFDFYLARQWVGGSKEYLGLPDLDDDDEGPTVASMFPLKKNYKLFYLYNFSMSWIFQISRVRGADTSPTPVTGAYQLVSEVGERPYEH